MVPDRMRRGSCTRTDPILQNLGLVAEIFPRRTHACGLGTLRELARVSSWHRWHGLDYRDHSGLGPIEELRLAYGCRGDWKRCFPEALQDLVALRELLAWIREHEGATDPRIIDWLSRIEAEIEISGFPRTGINVLVISPTHQASKSRHHVTCAP